MKPGKHGQKEQFLPELYFWERNSAQTALHFVASEEVEEFKCPIMLNVQVGSVVLKARFVVTDLLKSSKILLGTDFLIKNRIAIGAIGPKNTWECTVSPEGKVLTKISGKVTNKLSLELMENLTLAPCDVRKVALAERTSEKSDTVLSVSPIYQEYLSLKTTVKNSRLFMENHSLQPAALFNGFPLIELPATGIG